MRSQHANFAQANYLDWSGKKWLIDQPRILHYEYKCSKNVPTYFKNVYLRWSKIKRRKKSKQPKSEKINIILRKPGLVQNIYQSSSSRNCQHQCLGKNTESDWIALIILAAINMAKLESIYIWMLPQNNSSLRILNWYAYSTTINEKKIHSFHFQSMQLNPELYCHWSEGRQLLDLMK